MLCQAAGSSSSGMVHVDSADSYMAQGTSYDVHCMDADASQGAVTAQ